MIHDLAEYGFECVASSPSLKEEAGLWSGWCVRTPSGLKLDTASGIKGTCPARVVTQPDGSFRVFENHEWVSEWDKEHPHYGRKYGPTKHCTSKETASEIGLAKPVEARAPSAGPEPFADQMRKTFQNIIDAYAAKGFKARKLGGEVRVFLQKTSTVGDSDIQYNLVVKSLDGEDFYDIKSDSTVRIACISKVVLEHNEMRATLFEGSLRIELTESNQGHLQNEITGILSKVEHSCTTYLKILAGQVMEVAK